MQYTNKYKACLYLQTGFILNMNHPKVSCTTLAQNPDFPFPKCAVRSKSFHKVKCRPVFANIAGLHLKFSKNKKV